MGQPELAIRKNRMPLFIGVGAVLAIGVGAVVMASGHSEKESITTNVLKPAPAEEAPKPVAAAAAAAPAAPAPAAAPTKVSITSVPAGVEIYVDDALVGNTPYALAKPDGDKQLRVELRAPGYDNKTAVISSLSSDNLTLTMTKKAVEAPRPSAPAAPHAAAKPKAKAEAAPAPKEKPGAKPAKGRVQTEVLDPWD